MCWFNKKNDSGSKALDLLNKYVNEAEPIINKQLREDKADADEVALLDSLFQQNLLPRYVYRWLPSICVNIVNSKILDKAYLSCSKSVDIYLQHVVEADITCIRIQTNDKLSSVIVPNLLPERNNEEEIILTHGLILEVVSESQYGETEFAQFLKDLQCYDVRPNTLSDVYDIKHIRLIDAQLDTNEM